MDKIACLICGNKYKALAPHISRIHGVSADEYKQKFSLPFGQGLLAETTRQKIVDATTARVQSGEFGGEEARDLALSSHKRKRRNPPAGFGAAIKNLQNRSLVNVRQGIARAIQNGNHASCFAKNKIQSSCTKCGTSISVSVMAVSRAKRYCDNCRAISIRESVSRYMQRMKVNR